MITQACNNPSFQKTCEDDELVPQNCASNNAFSSDVSISCTAWYATWALGYCDKLVYNNFNSVFCGPLPSNPKLLNTSFQILYNAITTITSLDILQNGIPNIQAVYKNMICNDTSFQWWNLVKSLALNITLNMNKGVEMNTDYCHDSSYGYANADSCKKFTVCSNTFQRDLRPNKDCNINYSLPRDGQPDCYLTIVTLEAHELAHVTLNTNDFCTYDLNCYQTIANRCPTLSLIDQYDNVTTLINSSSVWEYLVRAIILDFNL